MLSKSALNAACIALLPLLLAFSGYFLLTGRFLHSLVLLIVLVLLMEARVRMGYRSSRRGRLFVTHLACGSLLAFALVVLITHASSPILPWAEAAFVGAALTGIFLVKGSWHRL